MSWIMKTKILNIEQVSVYVENIEYMNLLNIRYKWEVV